jgi:hypothetical protein
LPAKDAALGFFSLQWLNSVFCFLHTFSVLFLSQKTGGDVTNLDPSPSRIRRWSSPHRPTAPLYILIDDTLQQLYLSPWPNTRSVVSAAFILAEVDL